MASLSGEFSARVNDLSDRIIHLRMLVEATLDFPEEEIDFLEKYQARPTLDALAADLGRLIAQARQGVILREGLHVVLAGQPNVGKSSLLNALAGDDIAIVTPIAGTTRDKVVQEIHVDGVPLHRRHRRPARNRGHGGKHRHRPQLAGNRTRRPHPAPAGRHPARRRTRRPDHRPPAAAHADAEGVQQGGSVIHSFSAGPGELGISAKRGLGLDALRAELLKIAGWNPGAESPWLARERHLHALQAAAEHLALAGEHAEQDDRVLDLFAEELRLAHDSLSGITGKFTSDDLLGRFFQFCIGK